MNWSNHILHTTDNRVEQPEADLATATLFFSDDHVSIAKWTKEFTSCLSLSTYTLTPSLGLEAFISSIPEINPEVITLDTTKYCLIPEELFEAGKEKDYLEALVPILTSEKIECFNLPILGAVIAAAFSEQTVQMIRKYYPAVRFKTQIHCLLQSFLSGSRDIEDRGVLYFRKKSIDFMLVTKGKLKLYNSFSFENKEEMIYHIMNVFQQFDLNAEQFPLTLTGEISENSAAFDLLYRYIGSVGLWSPPPEMIQNMDMGDFPPAFYFTLLQQGNENH